MTVERDFPRAVVALQVELVGVREPLDVVVIPRRVSVTRRPHTHADSADVEIDGTEVPFDPRSVASVVVTVHMGNAAGMTDEAWRSANTRRFVGYADTFEGEQEDDDTIMFKARDLSAPLRDAKPLPADAVPKYSDSLGGAIQRILDRVPGAPALTLEMVDGDVPLAGLTSERTRGGMVHLENDMTAWAVIEYLAGLTARIVTVNADHLVVRLARSAYDHAAEPRATLEFNTATANLVKLKTDKKFIRNRKGIRCVSWDPAARTRIEADFPPDSELPPRTRPNATAGASSRRTRTPQPPERDVFPVQGVQTREGLLRVAESIWLERSRQELSVSAPTPYFTDQFLGMNNGDRVRLQLNRALAAGLNQNDPKPAQIAYVQRRLRVDRRVAELLVAAATQPNADLFYVHEATLSWNPQGDVGVQLDLINLVAVEAPRA